MLTFTMNDVVPIFHQVRLLNWLIFVIPVLALILGYTLYLIEHQNKGVPPFPIVLNDSRVSRIFSVMIPFALVLLSALFYIRSQVFLITAKVRGVSRSRRFTALSRSLECASVIICLGGFGMSFISEQMSYIAAVVSFALYSAGGIIYFICGDCMLGVLRTPSSMFSRVVTWVVIISGLLCVTSLSLLSPSDTDLGTVAGALEIMTTLLMQLKITLIGFDMPQHVVRMVAKK